MINNPPRLQRWLDASIGNRFSAVLLTLTLGFMIVAGAANFTYLLQLKHRISSNALAESVRDASNDFERALNGIQDDNRLLAKNPTIVSAVLDTKDQETYLYPLLSRFKPKDRTPASLCVTDYKGVSVGCASGPLRSYVGLDWIQQSIDSNRPVIRIVTDTGNEPVIAIATPISYQGTGGSEGALVAEYSLTALLLDSIIQHERYAHIHLSGADGDLYIAGDRTANVDIGRDLALDGVFAPLRLRLSLGISETQFNAPVLRLMAAYSIMGLLLAALAFWAARRAVPPLIARLTAITGEANRVAAGHAPSIDANTSENDEIGQLTRAFAVMTRRLNDTNQSLEAQVVSRTEALQQQQLLLRSIMDAVPGAIYQLRLHADGRTSVPFVSHALRTTYGLDPSTVSDDASELFARVHPDDIAAHMASIYASARQLSPWQQDYRVIRADGSIVWLHGNGLPRQEADGAVLWHGIVTDITEHQNAVLALADSEAYNKALFSHSYIPLVIMHPDSGVFTDCNEAAVEIYRFETRAQVIGKTPLDVSTPTQYDGTSSAEAAFLHIVQARANGMQLFEWRHLRPNGEIWDAEVRLMCFRHQGREMMQFSLRDVTEQKRNAAEVWRQANFDTLTGLANRSLCCDRLGRAMAQARRLGNKTGVLFVDLDGFKAINDELGHAAGDDLLAEAANRLKSCVREHDTAARFGGDEFVLVVHDLTDSTTLQRVAEQVIAQLNAPFTLAGVSRRISGSVGIAVFPDDADSLELLLEHADQALYQSKHAGKNRYSFFSQTTGVSAA